MPHHSPSPMFASAVVHEVLWGSRFRVPHRIADDYRAGRIVLAGDAAHVHSPAGGQGMNIGIQDAMALAEALATARAGGGAASLDVYGTVRRRAATQVVALTDRLTRLATVPRGLRPLRNTMLRMVCPSPAIRRRLAWQLSGLIDRPKT